MLIPLSVSRHSKYSQSINDDSVPKKNHSNQPGFDVSSLCSSAHYHRDAQLHPAVSNHECLHLVAGSSTETHDNKRRRSFGQDSELKIIIRVLDALGAAPHPPAVGENKRNAYDHNSKKTSCLTLTLHHLYLRTRHKDLPIVLNSSRNRDQSSRSRGLLSERHPRDTGKKTQRA